MFNFMTSRERIADLVQVRQNRSDHNPKRKPKAIQDKSSCRVAVCRTEGLGIYRSTRRMAKTRGALADNDLHIR